MDNFKAQGIFDKEALSIFLAMITYMIGPINQKVMILVISIVIDLVLGIMTAFKNNNFKLKKLIFKTVKKLRFYIIMLFLFSGADRVINVFFAKEAIRNLGIFVLFFMEFASIFNHLIVSHKEKAHNALEIMKKFSNDDRVGNFIELLLENQNKNENEDGDDQNDKQEKL